MSIDRQLPHGTTIRRRRAVLALLAAGMIGGTALAGCGGGADGSAASKRAKAEQAALDFARCMRKHGVDVPDPRPGNGRFAVRISVKGGNGRAKLKTAQAACQHFMKGAIAPPSAADQQKMLDAALKYSACMRKNGIDVPDPSPGQGGGIKIGPGSGPNPDAPAFKRADAKCRTLLPGAKFGLKQDGGPGGSKQGFSSSPPGGN
jgi:hypothetical protein